MSMMQHKLGGKVCVVNLTDFNASADLGAPFKVILSNGVFQETDESGKVCTTIPDLPGLFKAVVQRRVLHPRKLSGADLKFIRRAVDFEAKFLARKMDVTAEHLSRCEAGKKVLSGSSEKIFRMLAFVGSFCPDPQSVMVRAEKEKKIKSVSPELTEKTNKLLVSFMNMDIKSMFNAGEDLEFKFCLCDDDDGFLDELDDDDDTVWEPCCSEAA